MKKSPDAFRTISEVAAWLDTPAHVLRFWESRFPDLKPVQRAGGRRYYRRDDMLLLGGIKHLLHTEGHTIKSVQDRIAADGTSAVAAFSQPLGVTAADAMTLADQTTPMDGAADAMPPDGTVPEVRLARTDDDAPPIGFFFDDSDDAAPAEAQSGTFAPLSHPATTAPPPVAAQETTGRAVQGPDDQTHAAHSAADSLAPDLLPRLGVLPDLPDDPGDDAPGFGTPLPLSARLRALHPDDVPDAHRIVLTGLFRRLEGWFLATR